MQRCVYFVVCAQISWFFILLREEEDKGESERERELPRVSSFKVAVNNYK